jgi:hypothetical protein
MVSREEALAELQNRGVDPSAPPPIQKSSPISKEEAIAELKSRGIDKSEGVFGSLLRGMGNNMPLGNQFSALVSPGKYSDNMAAINEATANDKAAHPVAYGSGAVAGTLAPALVPGVGPMMAANPLTTGALMGGTNAISNTDIQQNPLEAANQAGTGASVGALFNGLLAKIAPPTQAALEYKSNKLANKSIDMPKGFLGDMTEAEQQAQGSALRKAGVVTKDKEVALDNAKALLNNYGKKIGSMESMAQKEALTANPDQHYGFISNLLDKAQQFKGSANRLNKAIGRDYEAGAIDIAKLGDNPSWSAIQNLKETYGELAFKNNATKGQKDTYFALANMLKGIADRAKNSGIAQEYKDALSGYSQMSPIVEGLRGAVDAELRGTGTHGHNIMALVRSLSDPARYAAGAVAAVTGHPTIAMATAIPEILNPAIQSQVTGGLAKAMPQIQAMAGQAATIGGSNAKTQEKVSDLIQKLKAMYDKRRDF